MSIQKTYPFDKELEVRAMGAAAITADGFAGDQFDTLGSVHTEFVLVLNLETVKVSAGDEIYTIRVLGSNTANRSDARVLAAIELGDAAAKPQDTADDVAGNQIVIPFITQRPAGTYHRYLDVHVDVGGTSPSIVFGAFFSRPQMM
jgi:hypothetical protein